MRKASLTNCSRCGFLLDDPDSPCPHCVRLESPEYKRRQWALFFPTPVPPMEGEMYRTFYMKCRRCNADLKREMRECPCCGQIFDVHVPEHPQDGLPDRADPGFICRQCDAPLRGGEVFCTGCGLQFTEPVHAPPGFTLKAIPLGSYHCPRCKARLDEGARFCPGCGGKLRAPVPAVAVRYEVEPDPAVWTTEDERSRAAERLARGETFLLARKRYPFPPSGLG